jgi:sugar phosphate isomerase/epimerase
VKIAFSTRTMDVHPHRYGEPLPEDVRGRVLRWGAAKGFDAAELEDSWALVEQMDDAALARLRDQARSAGIALTLKLHYRDLATPSVAAANEAGVRRNVEAAAKLGASVVSFSMPTADSARREVARELGRDWRPSSRDALPGAYEASAEAIRRLGRRAAELGVVLSVEMHQGSIVDTGASLLRLLDLVDMPNVGANPDLANLMQLNPPPEEDWRGCLARIAPRMNYWHVKNLRRYEVDGQPLLLRRRLDEGFVDYRWCVAFLLERGWDGFAVIEGPGFGDHLTVVEESRAYLVKLIEEHGALGI